MADEKPLTEEECFHETLDKTPNDQNARMIFADWLGDRDDPRADGYRALAAHGFVPAQVSTDNKDWVLTHHDNEAALNPSVSAWQVRRSALMYKWYVALKKRLKKMVEAGGADKEAAEKILVGPGTWFMRYPTRRALEDDLALAWADVAEEFRAELPTRAAEWEAKVVAVEAKQKADTKA